MKVIEIPVDIADLGNISQEQFQVRSSGIHVSSIIHHIMVTSGLQKNGMSEEMLERFAVIGRLWERILADTMFKSPRYVRPGEIECDGVIGSPDAIDLDDHCLMEFKVTWKSSSPPIDSFFKYMLQVKAYCQMLGLSTCRLYVFFVCGNYKPPFPQFKAWEISFSHHELKDNWDLLIRNSKDMSN